MNYCFLINPGMRKNNTSITHFQEEPLLNYTSSFTVPSPVPHHHRIKDVALTKVSIVPSFQRKNYILSLRPKINV